LFSAPKQKDENEIQNEIRGVVRQITASVTFLPLIECPCKYLDYYTRQMASNSRVFCILACCGYIRLMKKKTSWQTATRLH